MGNAACRKVNCFSQATRPGLEQTAVLIRGRGPNVGRGDLRLELEAGLAQDGVFVAFGEAFEEDALWVGGLPDPGFDSVKAQEAGQSEGIAAIMFCGDRGR